MADYSPWCAQRGYYTSLIFFIIISVFSHILNINGSANISDTTLYAISIQYTSNTILMISFAVLADGLFIVFIQHGCGLFSIFGYRLKHTLENEDPDIELNLSGKADEAFWMMAGCITKHSGAIEL